MHPQLTQSDLDTAWEYAEEIMLALQAIDERSSDLLIINQS